MVGARGEFRNDGIDDCSPEEGLEIFVPRGKEVVDGGDDRIDGK